MITALTSNQMIAPSYWVDPKTGNDYMLTVQYPEHPGALAQRPEADSVALGEWSGNHKSGCGHRPHRIDSPTEVDHYQLRRVIDVYVAPSGEDLGAIASKVDDIIAQTKLPEGVRVTVRGSVEGMRQSFKSFGLGLILSVVLVYLILMAQFASFIDPLIILLAIPPGITGVIVFLLLTHTTLNIMSLMGVIMMTGIVVSNSILIVDVTRTLPSRGHGHSRGGGAGLPSALASHPDDFAGHDAGPGADGAGAGGGQRAVRSAGARHHRRPAGVGGGDGVHRARGLPAGSSQGRAGGGMKRAILSFAIAVGLSAIPLVAQVSSPAPFPNSPQAGTQQTPPAQQPASPPPVYPPTSPNAVPGTTPAQNPPQQPAPQLPASGAVMRLTVQDAEALALKNNPQISLYRLLALASNQVTREQKAAYYPNIYGSLTAVEPEQGSRIAAGNLNNPSVFERAAGGLTLSQMITDFGRTNNLVASATLRAKASDMNAAATADQIKLAVDEAFYNALQDLALQKVAEQTVGARQLVSDQITTLFQNKLRSELDVSFADANLAQSKLLLLDAQNNYQAALSALSQVLGYQAQQPFDLVDTRMPVESAAGCGEPTGGPGLQ